MTGVMPETLEDIEYVCSVLYLLLMT